jgi:beta-aspartyl-peptidase (threonine type)
VVGAGNYCDDRLGGAACTGRGEMAIRSSTALRVLFGLSAGLAPAAACVEALRDAVSLDDDYAAPLQTLVLCPDGRHAGATTRTAGTYAVLTEEMSTYEIVPRNVV